jgi:hypothetical protein
MDFDKLDIADNNKTSAGKEGDDFSTQQIYKCANTFGATFVAEIDEPDVLVLSSKDIYIKSKADYIINCKLVHVFISW